MPTTSTPAQYILILIDMLERQGVDRASLLAGTSFAATDVTTIGARIHDADFNQVVANAQALTGDPALGLQLGLRLNLSAHAVLGQAFITCADLAEAMELFLKYNHLLASSLQLEFATLGEQCVLTIVNSPRGVPIEFGYELFYGGLINTLRNLLNAPDLCLRMEFPYPKPAHADLYYPVFGPDLEFDSLRARILIPSKLLGTKLPSSNPVLRNLYAAECARLLADLEEETSIAERTSRLLRKFEGQYPQLSQVAAMLNLSPRTYRRRLEAEQLSFQHLLDQVRTEHATRYLQNTRLPISNIAYLVGFSDASNFRRAYLKWTGRSPREVRRA